MSCDRARKQALLPITEPVRSGTLEMIDEGFLPRDPFPGLRQEAGYSATFALALFCLASIGNFFFESAFSGRLRPVRHCDGREPLNGGQS
jgi:hypothetical protein